MNHPIIFFRESEYNKISENYTKETEKINSEIDKYFSSINSIDELYKIAELSKDEKSYKNSFVDIALSKETTGRSQRNETIVDPFSYSYNENFDPLSSKGGFQIGILLIFLLFIFIIKKWPFKKHLLILIFLVLGLNLYNYYIKEPDFLKNKEFYINPTEYREKLMFNKTLDKFAELYEPKSFQKSVKTYEYFVTGNDENGDNVKGYITATDENGEGYITNINGDKIEIKVNWTGKGELFGIDENNNEYELKVE